MRKHILRVLAASAMVATILLVPHGAGAAEQPSEETAYDAALALDAAGYHGAAETLARKVAAETGFAIPPTLTRADDSLADRATDATADLDAIWGVVEAAIPLLIAGAVIGVFLLRRLRKPRVAIQSFECADDLCPGAVVAAQLVSELTTIGSGRNLERVADTSAAPTVAVEEVVPDRAKWAAALLRYIGLRRLIRVTGLAYAAGEHEVVITVTIANPNGSVFDSRSFTHRDAAKTARVLLRELVHDAAAWTLFRLNRRVGRTATRYLGTEDWRSWGRFRRAVWRETQGRRGDARDAYLEALEFDAGNWGAWLNLASLDLRDNPILADIRLQTARDLLAHEQYPRLEPAYYRLLYLRGIAHLNCSVHVATRRAEQEDHAQLAVAAGTELVNECAATTLWLGKRSVPWRPSDAAARRHAPHDLATTIALVQPTGMAMLASAKVNAGASVDKVLPGTSELPGRSERKHALQVLRGISVDTQPDVIVGLFICFSAAQQLPGGAHYNLACMYARALRPDGSVRSSRGESIVVEAAFLHLIRAVESTDRSRSAARDGAFTELRRRDSARFRRITGTDGQVASKTAPTPPPAPAPPPPSAPPNGHGAKSATVG
jgi:hypothetical protein